MTCKQEFKLSYKPHFEGQILELTCPTCQSSILLRMKLNRDGEPRLNIYENIAWLTAKTGNFTQKQWNLKTGINILGRGNNATNKHHGIQLVGDNEISRKHCSINIQKTPRGKWTFLISDTFPSTNGTFLNEEEERLSIYDEIYLLHNFTIRLGQSKLIFKTALGVDRPTKRI